MPGDGASERQLWPPHQAQTPYQDRYGYPNDTLQLTSLPFSPPIEVGESEGWESAIPPAHRPDGEVNGFQADVPTFTLINPTPEPSGHSTPGQLQAYSWIEPGPLPSHSRQSPFELPNFLDTPQTARRSPVPVSTPWFTPRPIEEYQALMRSSSTTSEAIQLSTPPPEGPWTLLPEASRTLKYTPRPFDEYEALMSHGNNLGPFHQRSRYSDHVETPPAAMQNTRDFSVHHRMRELCDGIPDPEQTALKRGRQCSHAKADTPNAAYSVNAANMRWASIPTTEKPTVTASELIGKSRNNKNYAHARPWGLQRILTHRFVEANAARLGTNVPVITDADVHLYCHSKDSPHHPIHSTVAPANVDVRLLGNIEISAEEILAFFPQHLKWHDVVHRLAQNGWSPNDMANYINYTRNLSRADGKQGNAILKWLQAADKVILGREKKSGFRDRKPFRTTCFTAKDWIPYEHHSLQGKIDYFLVDLADGLVRFPLGEGARLLTRAVRLAVARADRYVKLSEVRQYIRENLLIFPSLPSLLGQMMAGRHPDVMASARVRAEVRQAKHKQVEDRPVSCDL